MKQVLYLITGAAGHLGITLTQMLCARKEAVRALVLKGDPAAAMLPPEAAVYEGDVRDKMSLEAFFTAPEGTKCIVIHCAGLVSTASRFFHALYDINVTGTKNITDLCIKHKVKQLIYVSSVHAIPVLPKGEVMQEIGSFDPKAVRGPYAKTKAEATAYVLQAVREQGLNACIVFPSGICGPFDYGRSHLTQLLIDFFEGRAKMGIHGGFDFVDVRDVASGILACCQMGRAGEGYVLSSRYVSVKELFDLFAEVTGRKRTRLYVPLWLAKCSVPFCSLYYKLRRQPPIYNSYSLYTLSCNAIFSNEKAKRELQYQTRPFRETVVDTYLWLRENGRFRRKNRRAPVLRPSQA